MPPKQNARILIVEPDIIIAESLKLRLVKHGYVVESARTAMEAVEMAMASKPDVLIMEPHLENQMDGVTLANTILLFSSQTEIIISSAWDMAQLKASLKKPCELISKPYDEAEMVRIVGKCLATSRVKTRRGKHDRGQKDFT